MIFLHQEKITQHTLMLPPKKTGFFMIISDLWVLQRSFRLYGKTNNVEATGVSIVFKSSYFSKEDDGTATFQNDNKFQLYRCIYIDPDTQEIISLGHREEYTFYREFKKEITSGAKKYDDVKKMYERYQESYKETLGHVQRKLNELKQIVNDSDFISDPVVTFALQEILFPIRYLVKHVAFKEEQECRILETLPLQDRRVKIINDTLYLEYKVSIARHIKSIYFAPHARNYKSFIDKLLYSKETRDYIIKVKNSTHPFNLR